MFDNGGNGNLAVPFHRFWSVDVSTSTTILWSMGSHLPTISPNFYGVIVNHRIKSSGSMSFRTLYNSLACGLKKLYNLAAMSRLPHFLAYDFHSPLLMAFSSYLGSFPTDSSKLQSSDSASISRSLWPWSNSPSPELQCIVVKFHCIIYYLSLFAHYLLYEEISDRRFDSCHC